MDYKTLFTSLLDTLGIEDFTLRREFGRERGLNPSPTEAQNRAVDKLHQKLYLKSKSKAKTDELEEDVPPFDLKDKTRVILFEGKVLKKNTHSMVQSSVRRYGFLLNDVFIITSEQSGGGVSGLLSSEKMSLHQVIPLERLCVLDVCRVRPDEDVAAFEIITPDKTIHLIAESESDKNIWLEEIEAAVFCIKSTIAEKKIGWQHEVLRGTIFSAAAYGDILSLRRHFESRNNQNIDEADESGMTSLHWASIFGQTAAVEAILAAGSEIDHLNSGLNSALLLAAAMGQSETVIALINNGADPFIRNLKDKDCLCMALLYGSHCEDLKDLVILLKHKGVNVNNIDSSGASPLHACAAGSTGNTARAIQILVECGGDVNMKHGRSGLTPLQLACSTAYPDAETVRALLDNGAHPNWRDANMNSSFDMVLSANKHESAGSNSGSMEKTLDEVAEFVQNSLPSLMELVRKGCRYTPEAITSLRNSFQEVIKSGKDHFEKLTTPDGFSNYIDAMATELGSDKHAWVDDKCSLHCLLCVQKFTYSNRRHHCRACGILCCDLCSTKRLVLTKSKPGNTAAVRRGSTEVERNSGGSTTKKPGRKSSTGTSSGSGKGQEGDRVCDGCFNRLSHECFKWQQSLIKIRKQQEKLAQEVEQKKQDLLDGKSRSNSPVPPTSKAKQAKGNIDGAINQSAQVLEALHLRGERIQRAHDQAMELNNAASDFSKMTGQLLQQTKAQHAAWN